MSYALIYGLRMYSNRDRGNNLVTFKGWKSGVQKSDELRNNNRVPPGPPMTLLEHKVSDEFVELAEKFHVPPDRLAKICCDNLVAAKPDMLTIIARFSHDAVSGADQTGPFLK